MGIKYPSQTLASFNREKAQVMRDTSLLEVFNCIMITFNDYVLWMHAATIAVPYLLLKLLPVCLFACLPAVVCAGCLWLLVCLQLSLLRLLLPLLLLLLLPAAVACCCCCCCCLLLLPAAAAAVTCCCCCCCCLLLLPAAAAAVARIEARGMIAIAG